jgi:predicted DNA-binding ribbon-helix-helix protein
MPHVGTVMKPSRIVKRSITVADRVTSISIEGEFWAALRAIADAVPRDDMDRMCSVSKLVTRIDRERDHMNLSSAIRLFVLKHYRDAAGPSTNSTVIVP